MRICHRGHEVTGDNCLTKRDGYTACKECERMSKELRKLRKQARVPVRFPENASLK